MPKPWEEYQQTGGPWEEYQTSESPKVSQEMHPELGAGAPSVLRDNFPKLAAYYERFKLKNLSNSPESTTKYLTSQGFEVQDIGGQMAVRKPGEKDFKVIDPQGLDVGDVGDIGYDIAAGVGSGVGTAAGGVAGAAAGGVGAIPGAVAGGAASSAGLEALRQKLGQRFGIPQEVSGTDVAISGAVGGVSPLLLGTGATAKNLAGGGLAGKLGKFFGKAGYADSTAALNAQKGGVETGYNYLKQKMLPKTAEFISGVPSKAITTYAKRPDAVNALGSEGAMDEAVGAIHEKIKSGFAEQKNNIGQMLEQEIDSAGKTVNITSARAPLDEYIAKLESSAVSKNKDVKEMIQVMKQERDDMFGQVVSSVEKKVKPARLSKTGKILAPEKVTEKVVEKVVPLDPEISAKHAWDLQDIVKDKADLAKTKLGIDPRYSQASSKFEKGWSDAVKKSYTEINKSLSTATEGSSQRLKNAYRDYAQKQKEVSKLFKDPKSTEKTLSNLFNPSNKYTLDSLKELGEMSGGQLDVIPDAELLQSARYFSSPAVNELQGQGTTGTARRMQMGAIGGYLGYKAGGGLGAAAGGFAGGFLGSPTMMKHAYIPVAKGVGKVVETTAAPLKGTAPGAAQSIWQMMKNKENAR